MKRNEQFGRPAGNEKKTDLLPSAGELERAVPMDSSIKIPFNRESDGSYATSFTETSETNPSEIKVSSKDSSQNGNVLKSSDSLNMNYNQFGIDKLKNLTLKDTRDDTLYAKGERKDGGKENEIPRASVKDVKPYENWTKEAAKKFPCVLESVKRMESATCQYWKEDDYVKKDYELIKMVLPFLPGPPREINAPKTVGNRSIPSEDTSYKNKLDPKVVEDSSTCVKGNEGGKEKDVPLASGKDMKQDDDWRTVPSMEEFLKIMESNAPTQDIWMGLDECKWENLDSEVVLPKSAGKNATASEDTDSKKKSEPKWVSKYAGPSLWTLGMRQLSFCEDHFSLENFKSSAPQDSEKGEKSKEIEKDWEFVEDGIEMEEDWEFVDKDKGKVEKL